MRKPTSKHKFTEILVRRDNHCAFRLRDRKNFLIGNSANHLHNVQHVMPSLAQPQHDLGVQVLVREKAQTQAAKCSRTVVAAKMRAA